MNPYCYNYHSTLYHLNLSCTWAYIQLLFIHYCMTWTCTAIIVLVHCITYWLSSKHSLASMTNYQYIQLLWIIPVGFKHSCVSKVTAKLLNWWHGKAPGNSVILVEQYLVTYTIQYTEQSQCWERSNWNRYHRRYIIVIKNSAIW